MANKETHSGAVSTYITTTYTRDSRGRTLSAARDVGGTTMASVTYEYDELGRLISKSVGSSASENMKYDVHNWTVQDSVSMNGSPVFKEILRYAKAVKESAAARFDGNISEIQVIHNGVSDDTYAFQYDALKRLTRANRYIGNATTNSDTRTEKNMSYDRNGNLTALKRYGDTGLENNLTFTRSGNRMTGLSDTGSPGGSFSFTYDVLGNMTNDGRKGLVISYNVLNLPSEVTSSASGSLTYTYLSDGTKVSAIKSDGSGERYIGSFVYSVPVSGSEVLESAAWDEGRINFTKSGSSYTKTDLWFVKDHVGNVRTVVDVSTGLSAPQVLERNDFLPFGTRMNAGTAVLTTNRFRLGGKESQIFGSLDLGKVDFGARMFDPFTAGWTTADPLAAKYGSVSPYNYCGGNPIIFIDPYGKDWYMTTGTDGTVEYIYNENIKSAVDLKRLNISGQYLGETYLSSDKYYSLFGEVVQYKNSDGALTFEGQLFKSIDDLIIKNYSRHNSDNSIFNTEIEPEPSVDFFFNMPRGEYHFIYAGHFENQSFESSKEGTIYRAVNKENMRLKIQQMPSKEPRRYGGYDLGYKEPKWYGCFMLIGNNGFNTIQIQFDKQNAEVFRKAISKHFSR